MNNSDRFIASYSFTVMNEAVFRPKMETSHTQRHRDATEAYQAWPKLMSGKC
jgi:hypothetical protein